MRIELRDYQLETLAKMRAAEQRGVRRQAISAATGLGKTVMFSAFMEQRGKRALVLAHRDELIDQAIDKIREVWPDVPVGKVKADRNDVHAHVVVASVQTLARQSRLDQLVSIDHGLGLNRVEPFDVVIIDECHHAAADSYVRIIDGLNAGKPDGPLLLGFTATLDRGDGKGLDHLFDEVVADWPILWGIQHGYLCDLRGLRVKIEGLDLRQVKTVAGDYNAGQAGQALEDADAPEAIVRAWQRYAADRRSTLVFTPTVATAVAVAAEFVGAGVPFGVVSGDTPLEERRETLRRLRDGELAGVANCAVLTEGFDHPAVDCVVVARPTKSRSLYTQMVGRGTRRHPDKIDCLVLDVCGATEEHSLVGLPSLFGVERARFPEIEETGLTIGAWLDADAHEQARRGKITAEEAELFRVIRESGNIRWVAVHEPGAERKRYVRPLDKGKPAVVLASLGDGTWGAVLRLPQRFEANTGYRGWKYGGAGSKTLIRGVSQETAQAVAEEWIAVQEGAQLARSDAAWRKKPATKPQRDRAAKMKIPIKRGMTCGELADLMDAVIAKRDELTYMKRVGISA